jgi:hypothetical protein
LPGGHFDLHLGGRLVDIGAGHLDIRPMAHRPLAILLCYLVLAYAYWGWRVNVATPLFCHPDDQFQHLFEDGVETQHAISCSYISGCFCSYRLMFVLSLVFSGFLVAYALHVVSTMEGPLVVEATGPTAAC